jgi:hypothetical protein
MHFAKNSSSTVKADPQWKREATTFTWPSGQTSNTTKCYLMISTPNTMKAPILYYYQLTNFYQNHRRYAKSFNTDQLSGKAVSASTVHGSDCDPLTTTTNANGTEVPYYPCGLAANSQFNDTFYQPVLLNPRDSPAANETYNMTNKGISWSSDRQLYGESKYDWANVAVPPNWVGRYGDQYSAEDGHHPDLVNDEEFQVWMRLAGLPTFSKLALRNDTADLIDGTYEFVINHSTCTPFPSPSPTTPSPLPFYTTLTTPKPDFDVTEYGGTKSIIISTRTVMGGKNPFLGIAYVVVGGICIVLGALFTVTHLIRPRKLGDHTYLSWNNENANAGGGAMTSGRDGVLAGEGRA